MNWVIKLEYVMFGSEPDILWIQGHVVIARSPLGE